MKFRCPFETRIGVDTSFGIQQGNPVLPQLAINNAENTILQLSATRDTDIILPSDFSYA